MRVGIDYRDGVTFIWPLPVNSGLQCAYIFVNVPLFVIC
jgi:hypothetical protein